MKQIIIPLILFTCFLAGCGRAQPPAESPNPLAETKWRLVEIDGQPVLTGSDITLQFWGSWFDGEAGCNPYAGDYSVSAGTLRVTAVSKTIQPCSNKDVWDQENRYWENFQKSVAAQSARFAIDKNSTPDHLRVLDQDGNTILLYKSNSTSQP